MDYDVLKRILAALEARGVVYAIFGAVAMNLHGLVRATEDLDLFIAPDAANIERLRAALTEVFRDPLIAGISSADLLGDYPSVRYAPPEDSFYLDILTRLGDAFTFGDLEKERRLGVAPAKGRLRILTGMIGFEGLPGAELIAAGLNDLDRGEASAPALLVSIGAPRLVSLGVAVPRIEPDAEHRLYLLLEEAHGDAAHSQYNALLRRLVSFERALACGG